MITRFTQDEKDLYNQLFSEAEDILSGFVKVTSFENGVEYYEKKNKEEVTFTGENADDIALLYHPISDIVNAYQFLLKLSEGIQLYKKADKDYLDQGYSVARGITSLDEYFNWIYDLGNSNVKFLMLPLDELVNSMFIVDANARTIKVPDAFKRNGIAVQGDKLVETLWFQIDRYFDTHDFANGEIKINWQGKTEDIHGIENISYINYDFIPGKIIFPWVINGNVALESGQITFAIEISNKNDNGYIYNTKTEKVTVNAGLNHNGTGIQGDDSLRQLLASLENSPVSNGLVQAAEPTFASLSFGDYADINVNNQIEFTASAMSEDTGVISYRWMWRPAGKDEGIDLNNINKEDTRFVIEQIYSPLLPSEANGENYLGVTLYYKPSGDESSLIYRVYTGDRNNIPENITRLYTLQSKCTITAIEGKEDIIGEYYVIAQNRINYSSATKESNAVKVPGPEAVEFVEDIPESRYTSDKNKELTLKTVIDSTEGKAETNTSSTYVLEYLNIPDIQYDKDAKWEVKETLTSQNGYTFAYETPGRYRVKVINKRNNAKSEEKVSNICRVTDDPNAPEIALFNGDAAITNAQIDSTELNQLRIIPSVEGLFDTYQVKYEFVEDYIVNTSEGNVTKAPKAFTSKNYSSSEINTITFPLEKFIEEGEVFIGGNVNITVFNWLNGKESSTTIQLIIL